MPRRLLGLISDTHGLMRPEAIDALRDVDLIVHAGDVGKPEILEKLRKLAPVIAVRGNVDTEKWALQLPLTEIVEADGAILYVLHDLEQLDLDPAATGFQIVVSGHTHEPRQARKADVLYINPGSAGPRRFHLPISVARLDLSQAPWKLEFVDLARTVR